MQRLAHRVANVLCWTLTIRLRQREAALRQRFAEEQKKQLEALAHTYAPVLKFCSMSCSTPPDSASLRCREQAAKAQLVACSAGVLSWLRSLGNPELTLEQKIGVQLPTGELGCVQLRALASPLSKPLRLALSTSHCRSSMQKLYGLASESSGALQQTLASAGQQFTPEGQKAFFRSEHTARVIEQEAQLKQLVYAQVLYGTA